MALSLLGAMLTASPAAAITEGHAYSFSFGSPGTGSGQFSSEFGQGLAVDQTTGDVYAADTANHRIEKFTESGTFLSAWGYGVLNGNNVSQVCNAPSSCQAGISGGAPGQFINPTAVAVDSSGGPSNGDVYVADTGNAYGGQGLSYILKFDSNGTYLGRINGEDTLGGAFAGLPWNGAIAVDGLGNLFVTTGERVMKFDAEDNEYVGGSEWVKNGVFSIAVNPGGSKMMVTGYVPSGNEGSYLVNANGSAPGPDVGCGSYFAGDIGFDTVTNHFLVGAGGSICEFTQGGEKVGEFGSGILTGIGGIGSNASTGNIYVMDWGSSVVRVFVPRVVPEVTTEAPTNVLNTSATLHGETTPDPSGGGPVTACKFEYATDQVFQEYWYLKIDEVFKNYGSSIPCSEATPYSATTPVSANLTGLTTETKYRYRLVVTNSIDSNAGKVLSFTPHQVIGLTTGGPTNLTTTSATLNGSFDPDGSDTHYYFEWGPTTEYGNVTAAPPGLDAGSASGVQNVSANVTGLTSYTKYHYRIVASNSLGTSHGDDEILRTFPPQPPNVSSLSVSNITATGAHLSGSVIPNLGSTIYQFQYGPTTSYGLDTPVGEPLEGDESTHSATAQLTGLQPGFTYHVRLVATNFGGSSHTGDAVFTTQAAPEVIGTTASAVGTSTASLQALVNPHLSSTTYHFEYGKTTAYGSSTPESASIGADESFHQAAGAIGGLAEGTAYHFRVVAVNGIDTSYGPDLVFTTSAVRRSVEPPRKTCRKGFVKKHGRCVKKQQHHKKRKRHRSPAKGRG